MAYNESLANRVKEILDARKVKYTEKKMLGGFCFHVDDKTLIIHYLLNNKLLLSAQQGYSLRLIC